MSKQTPARFRRKYKDRLKKKKLGIEEPVRKTMYDVVMENLKIAGRKTFLHRVIYIGRHTFDKDSELAISLFGRTIETKGIEPITGLYLHYRNLFVHVVETDEDSITKHLKLLYADPDINYLYNIKLLGDLCHINNRLISFWATYVGTPKLLVNPPSQSENETVRDAAIQVFNCINKINRLVDKMYGTSNMSLEQKPSSYRNITETSGMEPSVAELKKDEEGVGSRILGSFFIGDSASPYRDFLPENELLDYLVSSPFTRDLMEYLIISRTVLQETEYNDRVWPAPADFIQYDIFENIYDREFNMPVQGKRSISKKKEISGEEVDIDIEEEEEESR